MLFFLSMFVCMFFFYVPMFYVNLHSLYQYQEDSAVSAEVPNTMGSGLRFDPSVPDGWKDKDFPHDQSSIGTRADTG